MNKRKPMLVILLVFVVVDIGCLLIGKPQSWLDGFGARGLVLDFFLGIVVLVQYVKGDAES